MPDPREDAIKFGMYLGSLHRSAEQTRQQIRMYHNELPKSAIRAAYNPDEIQQKLRKLDVLQSQNLREMVDDLYARLESAKRRAETEYGGIKFAQIYVSKLGERLQQLRKVLDAAGSDLFEEEDCRYLMMESSSPMPLNNPDHD